MSLTLAEHHRPDATAGAPTGDERLGSFTFEDEIEGVDVPLPSVSPRQQETFKALFSCEMKALDAWAAKEGWLLPSPFPTLHIYVSRQYEFAASLWPQWKGQIGRMNFPAYRVAVGEANVLHELVHVYFPNGNRMLAEGLAVHLQQEIGYNAVFPNFGEDLHDFIRGKLESELRRTLDDIHLETLEKISTPSMLMFRLQRHTTKGAWAYVIAGSFTRFLIDAYGWDKYRILYAKTPLIPRERDAGDPERWDEVFGHSLAELALQWKAMIASRDSKL